jgi:inositol polyphosphate 5-phosphatase INPP5B/F
MEYIPPLPDVSPFKVDDPTTSPLGALDPQNTSGDSEDSAKPISFSHSSNVAFELDKASVATQIDPDLIVVGFQELDLSTGALLYSTETTREDAWFTAVMAGLGEKAVLYEKV